MAYMRVCMPSRSPYKHSNLLSNSFNRKWVNFSGPISANSVYLFDLIDFDWKGKLNDITTKSPNVKQYKCEGLSWKDMQQGFLSFSKSPVLAMSNIQLIKYNILKLVPDYSTKQKHVFNS